MYDRALQELVRMALNADQRFHERIHGFKKRMPGSNKEYKKEIRGGKRNKNYRRIYKKRRSKPCRTINKNENIS